MRKVMMATLIALSVPGIAQASAFTNGGFESSSTPSGYYLNASGASNSTILDGWTITSGDIDYIGTFWQAGEGGSSLDMDGLTAGTIAQTFDTIVGQTYDVGFLLAGNPLSGPAVKSLLVSTGGAASEYLFDTTGKSQADMGWAQLYYTFTATGASTTLSFASNTPGAWGAALDGVSVAAVPEPTTWAMLIGGLGMLGGTMRRRREEGVLARA